MKTVFRTLFASQLIPSNLFLILPQVHMKEAMSSVWIQGLDQGYLREQVLGEPLMREVIREYCNAPLGGAALQGEALLAAFKPRGYSECIVTVGGEERG